MTTKDLISKNWKLFIYRSSQFMDNDPNPRHEDVTFHLTEKEAMQEASKIKLNVGFYAMVDEIELESLQEVFEESDEFEFTDLQDYVYNIETIWDGEEHRGENIEGAIIIEWSWEKYIGYARNLTDLGKAGDHTFYEMKNEIDLITGNAESTNGVNFSVLLTRDEIEEAEDLEELIDKELNKEHWKWNYFKHNPKSEYIREKIEDILKQQ